MRHTTESELRRSPDPGEVGRAGYFETLALEHDMMFKPGGSKWAGYEYAFNV